MARKEYQCAMCGNRFFGDRSICRGCEKKVHHAVRKASADPHGVRMMERT